MIYKAKKLWNGSVSVRDYIVNETYKKGEDLIVEFEGKQMTVPNNMLLFGHKNRMNNISNFSKNTYDLIDFFWIPDQIKNSKEIQEKLL